MDELRYIKTLLKQLETLKIQQMVHFKFLTIVQDMIKELDRIIEDVGDTKNRNYAHVRSELNMSNGSIEKLIYFENEKDYKKTVQNAYNDIESILNEII